MTKKTGLILLFLSIFVIFAFIVPFFVVQKFTSIETFQSTIKDLGALGWIAYIAAAMLSTVILPLNYGIVGLAGGLIYGPGLAFLLLWIGRVLGNMINFFLAKKLGRSIVKVFVSEKEIEKFDKLLGSEKAILLYFVLCFLPFFPGDYAAYFLGCSQMKKRVFIPVTILATTGSAFSLAYVGSGEGFTNPIFLSIFSVLFLSGIAWIHTERKKFQLT